jgi:hypothetical protein
MLRRMIWTMSSRQVGLVPYWTRGVCGRSLAQWAGLAFSGLAFSLRGASLLHAFASMTSWLQLKTPWGVCSRPRVHVVLKTPACRWKASNLLRLKTWCSAE